MLIAKWQRHKPHIKNRHHGGVVAMWHPVGAVVAVYLEPSGCRVARNSPSGEHQ